MIEELKQVILVRNDLKMSKGKIGAQVGHACVGAVLKCDKSILKKWLNSGQKKVCLKVNSKEELYKFNQIAKDMGICTNLITDAGHTELKPNTQTTLAIGPDFENNINKVTNDLKLL